MFGGFQRGLEFRASAFVVLGVLGRLTVDRYHAQASRAIKRIAKEMEGLLMDLQVTGSNVKGLLKACRPLDPFANRCEGVLGGNLLQNLGFCEERCPPPSSAGLQPPPDLPNVAGLCKRRR